MTERNSYSSYILTKKNANKRTSSTLEKRLEGSAKDKRGAAETVEKPKLNSSYEAEEK